jgi:hypothetical protein
VADGTYSWNETTGNPGSTATATSNVISGFVVGATITNGGSGYTVAPVVTITGNGSGAAATATISGGAVTAINITNAGSGYSTGATITIAPPVIPFQVTYAAGGVTATYSSPPAVGRTITATYRYSGSGISGALAAGGEQWLQLSVAGIPQLPRQRVLAVPFAMHANSATTAGLNAAAENRLRTLEDSFLMRQLDDYAYRNFTKPNLPAGFIWESMTSATGKNGYVTSSSSSANYLNQNYYPLVYSIEEAGATNSTAAGQSLVLLKSITANAKIGHAEARFYQGPQDDLLAAPQYSTRIVFVYEDNTFSNIDGPNVNEPVYVLAQNPQPSKTVQRVEFRMTVPNYSQPQYNRSSCDNARLAKLGSVPVTLTLPTQQANWIKFHVSLTGSREQGDAITYSVSNGIINLPNLLPDQVYNWTGSTAPITLTLHMQPAPNGTPRATSITTVGIFTN